VAGTIIAIALSSACATRVEDAEAASAKVQSLTRRPISDIPQIKNAVQSAIDQTLRTFEYDPSYTKLDYPGGDVPIERGVCADVIVRAFRSAGVDLQKEVHEDMTQSFAAYPTRWSLRRPDSNIDHRRVPNLMTFFEREGKSLPITRNRADYIPGDVVSWELENHSPHIGLVVDAVADGTPNYLIVHNIGAGARIEDVLMAWKITGHYRMWK
jgi:uncharacterized protein YijF (DUF1287 family)